MRIFDDGVMRYARSAPVAISITDLVAEGEGVTARDTLPDHIQRQLRHKGVQAFYASGNWFLGPLQSATT